MKKIIILALGIATVNAAFPIDQVIYFDSSLQLVFEYNPDFCLPINRKGADHVTLESDLLSRLDGVAYMLDGINIKESMIVIRDLLEKQIGRLDKKTGKRLGKYPYKGINYGIHFLVKIEREAQDKAVVKDVLRKAKLDIYDLLKPFIDQVNAARWIVMPIMKEWVNKRKRTDTFLLSWAECHGNEMDVYDKHIKSIHDLDRFCTDLRIFLGDLIHNCPKGYAQFQELLKQHENK